MRDTDMKSPQEAIAGSLQGLPGGGHPRMMPDQIGKRMGKAVLALFVMLLTLCILELGLRSVVRVTSQEPVMMPDSVLGWKLIPSAKVFFRRDIQDYHITVNSKGLRDREHAYDKGRGVFRILVMGDSMVFGSGGVEASERFTDILEGSAKNVEMINMGVPGYGPDQEYLYLKTEGLRYHPDLVLFCAFWNDFQDSYSIMNYGRPKGYTSLSGHQLVFHPPVFSGFYKLSQHVYLLKFVDRALMKIYRQSYFREGPVTDRQTRLEVLKQLFASAADLCREHGVEFVLVYLPLPGQKDKINIQEVMEDLASTQRVRTLDLTDTLRNANSQRPAYFGDTHFNEYGHQVVARALHEYLATNGIE
jgi:GDSL-like Lipase/Acylhydrolase family